MRTRLTAIFMTLVPIGLAPTVALAQAACGDYNATLTQEQQDYIDAELEVTVPDGELPIIQRCDVDDNLSVDINDIRAIAQLRNTPAAHNQDPADWDRNGQIDILDARGCQRACANPRCAVSTQAPEEPEGGIVETAECFQVEDFDGDGKQDFVAVYEQAGGEQRGGDWTLEVVILTEDAAGEVKHITYPYTGKKSGDDEIDQHLGPQEAGDVKLHPGMITTTKPSIVSYRDGEPKVIYYYDENGDPARAFYGVDD
jgi:hypothetical protein